MSEKPLLDLERNECRWPVTERAPHFFCAEVTKEGETYCLWHRTISRSGGARPNLERYADVYAGGRAKPPSRVENQVAQVRMSVDAYMKDPRAAKGARSSWHPSYPLASASVRAK